MESRGGSFTTRNWLGRTFSSVCTTVEGHSIRISVMFVASPSPKCALSGELLHPPPGDISRNCQTSLPAMTALTRTFAPIADRLEAVPSHRMSIQPLELPLFL